MKYILCIAICIAIACVFSTCATTHPAAVITKQTYTFGYKTTNTAKPGSSTVLLGLIRPSYANNFSFSNFELFDNFRKYMGDDIQQLLNDKGFNLLNKSYASYDEITYTEKKDVQIALDIKIIPTFTAPDGGWTEYRPFSWNGVQAIKYGYSGTVSLSGHIVIKGIEPMTNQQIFTKSLDIPVVQDIPIKTSHQLDYARVNAEFFSEPTVYNALGAALQQSYTNIMHQIDVYLDPQELASYLPEVKELKGKKSF